MQKANFKFEYEVYSSINELEKDPLQYFHL